jgi:hypothetical protein
MVAAKAPGDCCRGHSRAAEMSNEHFDRAVENYLAVM